MSKGARNRAKHAAKVQAVVITSAQREAIKKEIDRQILRRDVEYLHDVEACVLWALHDTEGWGAKRLRRFWLAFMKTHEDLRQHYELNDDTNDWICRYKLKTELGIDLDEWDKETKNGTGTNDNQQPGERGI